MWLYSYQSKNGYPCTLRTHPRSNKVLYLSFCPVSNVETLTQPTIHLECYFPKGYYTAGQLISQIFLRNTGGADYYPVDTRT